MFKYFYTQFGSAHELHVLLNAFLEDTAFAGGISVCKGEVTKGSLHDRVGPEGSSQCYEALKGNAYRGEFNTSIGLGHHYVGICVTKNATADMLGLFPDTYPSYQCWGDSTDADSGDEDEPTNIAWERAKSLFRQQGIEEKDLQRTSDGAWCNLSALFEAQEREAAERENRRAVDW